MLAVLPALHSKKMDHEYLERVSFIPPNRCDLPAYESNVFACIMHVATSYSHLPLLFMQFVHGPLASYCSNHKMQCGEITDRLSLYVNSCASKRLCMKTLYHACSSNCTGMQLMTMHVCIYLRQILLETHVLDNLSPHFRCSVTRIPCAAT